MKAREEFQFSREAKEWIWKGGTGCLVLLILLNVVALAILFPGKSIGEFTSYRAGLAWVPRVNSTVDLLAVAGTVFVLDVVAALLLLVRSFFARRIGVLLLTSTFAGVIFFHLFVTRTLHGSIPAQLNGMAQRVRTEDAFLESLVQFAQEHAGRTNEIQFDVATAHFLYRLNGSRPDTVRGDGARIHVGWGRHRSTGGVGMIIGSNREAGSYIEYLQVQSNVVVYIVPPF